MSFLADGMPFNDHISPASFQRPFLTARRAALNADDSTGPVVPLRQPITADDFARPLITAGHETVPPGALAGNADIASVRTGAARDLYASASTAAAEVAGRATTDHITAGRAAHIGPMAPSRPVMPEGMRDTAVPLPYRPMNVRVAPGEQGAAA